MHWPWPTGFRRVPALDAFDEGYLGIDADDESPSDRILGLEFCDLDDDDDETADLEDDD